MSFDHRAQPGSPQRSTSVPDSRMATKPSRRLVGADCRQNDFCVQSWRLVTVVACLGNEQWGRKDAPISSHLASFSYCAQPSPTSGQDRPIAGRDIPRRDARYTACAVHNRVKVFCGHVLLLSAYPSDASLFGAVNVAVCRPIGSCVPEDLADRSFEQGPPQT